MAKVKISPTDKEIFFHKEEIIVSKTDLKGKITYANEVFLRVAGYTEKELMAEPHSILRHPDMPRCVFKLLWDKLAAGEEVFAYVKNICKNGDFYWVFAHVTPSFDINNVVNGYHSSRRVPEPEVVQKVAGLYEALLKIENSKKSRKEGMHAAFDALVQICEENKMTYDEFVFSLTPRDLGKDL